MEPTWTDGAREPIATMRLVVEADLSQTCRRDSFCATCMQAFCSHCCQCHHDHPPSPPAQAAHSNLRVDLDAAGQPVFPTHYSKGGQPIDGSTREQMMQHDYVTTLGRNAYCIKCMRAFSTGIGGCHYEHCGRDAIVRRIEELGGRHYVRCKGDEKWFAGLETVLGDPVGSDYGDLMLLPLLRRGRGACAQCGGPVPCPRWSHCSSACAIKHDQEVAQRRDRRDARRVSRYWRV